MAALKKPSSNCFQTIQRRRIDRPAALGPEQCVGLGRDLFLDLDAEARTGPAGPPAACRQRNRYRSRCRDGQSGWSGHRPACAKHVQPEPGQLGCAVAQRPCAFLRRFSPLPVLLPGQGSEQLVIDRCLLQIDEAAVAAVLDGPGVAGMACARAVLSVPHWGTGTRLRGWHRHLPVRPVRSRLRSCFATLVRCQATKDTFSARACRGCLRHTDWIMWFQTLHPLEIYYIRQKEPRHEVWRSSFPAYAIDVVDLAKELEDRGFRSLFLCEHAHSRQPRDRVSRWR